MINIKDDELDVLASKISNEEDGIKGTKSMQEKALEVKGKKIALVAFTTADHSYNLLEVDVARKTVEELSRTSDLIIVSFHGGAEGSQAVHVPDEMEHLGSEPRGHLIHFAHTLVDAGADLIIGHHNLRYRIDLNGICRSSAARVRLPPVALSARRM